MPTCTRTSARPFQQFEVFRLVHCNLLRRLSDEAQIKKKGHRRTLCRLVAKGDLTRPNLPEFDPSAA